MNGKQLTQACTKIIETTYKGKVVNVIAANKAGVSDLICCIEGNFFAFEIKGKGDRPSELQNTFLNAVRNAGGYGGFVYDVTDLYTIINDKLSPPVYEPKTTLEL